MSRSFKSLVSTSLFMSLFFMPTMASAASSSNMNTGQGTTNPNYGRPNWDSNSNAQGSSYNRQGPSDDQDDQGTYPRGQGANYGRQGWSGNQGTAYNTQEWADNQGASGRQGMMNSGQGANRQGMMSSGQGANRQGMMNSGQGANRQGMMSSGQGANRQGWATGQTRSDWEGNQGAMYSHQGWQDGNAWNHPYYGASYNNAPRYYSGSDYYVSSPTHYGPSGYPAYQSMPADGYYYNPGYGNGDYPYSQEYHDGQGMEPHMYFNVR